MTKKILIFRHGQTDWNVAGRMQGHTDIPLNDVGRAQAEKLREFFVREPVEVFFSSDLERAAETARIARGELRVPIIKDARLRETNMGLAEGLTVDELVKAWGPEAWEQWRSLAKEHVHYRFPQGESRAEQVARLITALEDFLRESNYSKVAVASHGGSIRRIVHHLVPDLTSPIVVDNCVVYEMNFNIVHGHWQVNVEPRFLG